jgi:putative endonuclease
VYFVYILKCADDSLYTGIATDVARRLREHNEGRGAKYTRGRGPMKLVFKKKCRDRSQASREELRIKKLPREEKLSLIAARKR